MSDNQTNGQVKSGSNTAMQIIGRLIASAVILAITAFFTPGFEISGFWALAAAAVVLAVMDYLIVKFTGLQASSFGRGFVGFVLSAIILYVTQYFVAGYTISWIASIVGALVYGIVSFLIPGDQSF